MDSCNESKLNIKYVLIAIGIAKIIMTFAKCFYSKEIQISYCFSENQFSNNLASNDDEKDSRNYLQRKLIEDAVRKAKLKIKEKIFVIERNIEKIKTDLENEYKLKEIEFNKLNAEIEKEKRIIAEIEEEKTKNTKILKAAERILAVIKKAAEMTAETNSLSRSSSLGNGQPGMAGDEADISANLLSQNEQITDKVEIILAKMIKIEERNIAEKNIAEKNLAERMNKTAERVKKIAEKIHILLVDAEMNIEASEAENHSLNSSPSQGMTGNESDISTNPLSQDEEGTERIEISSENEADTYILLAIELGKMAKINEDVAKKNFSEIVEEKKEALKKLAVLRILAARIAARKGAETNSLSSSSSLGNGQLGMTGDETDISANPLSQDKEDAERIETEKINSLIVEEERKISLLRSRVEMIEAKLEKKIRRNIVQINELVNKRGKFQEAIKIVVEKIAPLKAEINSLISSLSQ